MGNTDSVASQIRECFHLDNKSLLNIAITGETGAGKSSFINAFRGIKTGSEGAAATGGVETTMKPTSYSYPDEPNVKLWDLPGIGTPNFPAKIYLELVGFKRFDVFFLISSDRFRENDVKLAKEMTKRKRAFYFVRTKMECCLQGANPNHTKDDILQQIRDNSIQGLEKAGVRSPKVFLVDSFKLHLYDFQRLMETLERDLPQHKMESLVLIMPTISPEIIEKKKQVFMSQVKLGSSLCKEWPDVFTILEMSLLHTLAKRYVHAFGLNVASLRRVAEVSGKSPEELKAVITSPLAATLVTDDLIHKVLKRCVATGGLTSPEQNKKLRLYLEGECLKFETLFEIIRYLVNMLAEDAVRVVNKAVDSPDP